jgi:hypothetical protein
MTTPRAHHYVPKFLLKNFTDPLVPAGQTPFLWYLDGKTKRWKKRAPHNVAFQSYFYGFQLADGTYDVEWEKWLSQVESVAAPTIRKLIARQQLDAEEQMSFAMFVATMHLRNPEVQRLTREAFDRVSKLHFQALMHGLSSSAKTFEAHKRRWAEKSGDDRILALSLDELSAMLRTRNLFDKRDVIHATMSSFSEVTKAIMAMNWGFAFAESGGVFILSDRPCTIVSRSSSSLDFCGFAHPDAELVLPISRDLVFRAVPGNGGREWLGLKDGAVASINVTTALWGTGEIFSPTRDFPGSSQLEMSTTQT